MTTARERTLKAQGKATKPAGVLRITVDGQTVDVDPRTLTIRENWTAKKMLEESGYPDDFHFSSAASAWIIGRRTITDLAFDDVIDQMTIGDLIDSNHEVDSSPEV